MASTLLERIKQAVQTLAEAYVKEASRDYIQHVKDCKGIGETPETLKDVVLYRLTDDHFSDFLDQIEIDIRVEVERQAEKIVQPFVQLD